MTDNLTHYVYYSYEENGRGYIGSRSCKCLPEEDIYYGSYKDKTFKPTAKVILAICETKEQRYELEYLFQKLHNVVENPHFANRAFQTNKGFSRLGLANSEESRRKMSESRRNKPSGMKGKKHSEETKARISESLKGKPCPARAVKWTEERRIARSKAQTGRKGVVHSEKVRQIIREKLSIQIYLKNTITGEIKNFSSQKKAADFLSVSQGAISNLYRQQTKQIKNWVLANEDGSQVLEDLKPKIKFKNTCLMNVKTKEILKFKSVKDAADYLGVWPSTISKIMRGRVLAGHCKAPNSDPTDSD